MNNIKNSHIAGIGYYVPDRVIDNNYFTKYMDTSDQWIRERTGIHERRFISNEEGPSDLAIPAIKMALESASMSKDDIDFIIFSTSTPDYYIPGSGCLVQEKMKFKNIGALDIRCQCSGFIYGLSIADQYIKAGTYSNILVVTSEVQSTAMDLSNDGRDTSIIFADGAAATIITSAKSDNEGLLSTHLHSEGKYAKELWVEAPSSKQNPRLDNKILNDKKHFLHMNGKEVFKHAIKRFPEVIIEGLVHNNLTVNDIDILIPHQANIRISKMVQKKLGLKDEQVISNIHKYGNTTSASIPIALYETIKNKKIKKGDILALAAFGSGFSWGSAIIKW
jgi:3-oxoacyl-[acyl-carrier-protein] synthase-3|tara:strand:+ start:2200 stop:3204 length:1005 start_codon:yes stop_codon:yes gene_type:complete